MKILSTEINLGSASNVSNASVVRLFNSGTDNILVTRKDYAGTVVGSFMVPAGQVVYGEKYFTDTLEASADVKASKTAYSSMMSFVGQTADPLPTYTVSVSASAVDEGGNFTVTLSTTNIDDGTQFNYVLSGTGITTADFTSGSLNGTVTISNNAASFTQTVVEDTLTEGTETVTIKFYDASMNYVGNTVTVSLNDTSTTPAPLHSAHRYWRIVEGGNANYQIHPRSARLGLNTENSLSGITWLYTFTSDNCSDTGTYTGWTPTTYDHGSPISFTHYAISSVFNGSNYGMTGSASLRAGTYKVEYSDDGSSWTLAWAGVAANSSQDGTGAEAIYPSTGEDKFGNNTCFCGHGIMQGSRFGPDNPNDGTDWGSKWSGGSFDQSIDLAFDGYLRCGAYRARTGGNAVLITMSGVSITVNEYVKVYVENNYPSTVTATIDGVTYTSAHTGSQVHTHTFTETGTLTQLTVVNNGSQGRTYLEGVVVDGYLLKNNTTSNGWNY